MIHSFKSPLDDPKTATGTLNFLGNSSASAFVLNRRRAIRLGSSMA